MTVNLQLYISLSVFSWLRGSGRPTAAAEEVYVMTPPPSRRFGSAPGYLAAPIVLAVAAAAWVAPGHAQTPDVLGALLTEVRGLRAAMEQMASAGPRVQLALGRLQLQEQRINTMLRRQDQLKDSIAATQQEAGRIEGQLKGLSETSADLAHETQRQIEMEQKALKAVYAQAQASLQRLQHEEATLAQEISIEQGRWTDLNRGLEDLERSLIRR
jgi:hypothetical protein